ncbi:MAG TPA: hypothetical protein VHE08_00065 [Solirubrobacterales bacterium]|nr:hypothetical protein [Solirubrobacterales bacterium]
MKPSKRLLLVLSALCLAALSAAPAASAAGTVATGRACYAAEGSEGVDIGVTGSGFNPGELVFAQVPAPNGLAGYAETTVAPDGSLAVTVEHIFPNGIEPVAETMQMQIKGVLSGQILAEVPFQITNLAVATKPPTAPYTRVVKYMFAGFRPGKPIFGHYFRHGRLALTHKFGKAKGPCGILHVKAKLFPGHSPRSARYKVQFDDSKKVDPKAHPKIVTSLGVAF